MLHNITTTTMDQQVTTWCVILSLYHCFLGDNMVKTTTEGDQGMTGLSTEVWIGISCGMAVFIHLLVIVVIVCARRGRGPKLINDVCSKWFTDSNGTDDGSFNELEIQNTGKICCSNNRANGVYSPNSIDKEALVDDTDLVKSPEITMDESYKCLSVRLYDVMEHVGASEEMRQLQQSTAIQWEITDTLVYHMKDRNISNYIFGSFMESTTTPGLHSDIDNLLCDDDHPVHENIADARAGQSYLMVRDAHTRPGYVKLQIVRDGVPQTVYHNYKDKQIDSDRDGRICLKHYIAENCDERNGPADTVFEGTNLYSSDYVSSVRCSSLPRFADGWTKRKREFNWPSRLMLDSMKSSGCFVVGVGHPSSDEKHIEWRLSFSLQERDMMLSFNPTQHKCYIILKMVKNNIIRRIIGICVSSYHIKTCMFYLIQNTKSRIWIPENLFLCLSLCLNVLLKWVSCGYCPNYFIKEENMFDRAVHRQFKQPLSSLLGILIQAGPGILVCIHCDNINQYLIHPESLPATIVDLKKQRYMMCVTSNNAEKDIRRSLLSSCMNNRDGKSTCLFLKKLLQYIQNDSILNRKPDNHSRKALSRIETYINSILGSSYMSLAFSVGEPDIKRSLLNMAEMYFQQGGYCDMTSSRLMYASVLYTARQYDRCVCLLEEIDAELGHHVVSSCSCHDVDYEGDPTQYPSSYVNTASCVIFLPTDRNITPAPLLPEMYRSVGTTPGSRDEEKDFWFDCAAVDGKVYLHFLKYLAYSKLNQREHKQVAIDNIIFLIDNELNLGHKETAYNLLGWIHIQNSRIREGEQVNIWCFVESWKIRPEHNAAKWHMRSLVWQMANRGVHD